MDITIVVTEGHGEDATAILKETVYCGGARFEEIIDDYCGDDYYTVIIKTKEEK